MIRCIQLWTIALCCVTGCKGAQHEASGDASAIDDAATPLSIATPSPLADGSVDTNYVATLTAQGGTAPYAWTVVSGALPAGLTLDVTSGVVSGPPSTAGTADFTVQVADSASPPAVATKSFALTIGVAALSIVTISPLQEATVGTPYSAGFAGSGGTLPYTWAITSGALPAGLALDSASGAVSGTPTTATTANFTIEATDALGTTASAPFALTVAPAGSLTVPTNFRVDVKVGTTGALFVSWDGVAAAKYYNLNVSTNATSGYAAVTACSGPTHGLDATKGGLRICRDPGRTVGTTYYYEVQACDASGSCSAWSAPAANSPVASNCTAAQIPPLDGLKTPADFTVKSSVVDAAITFQPDALQHAAFPANGVTRRHQLFIDLPGSGELCGVGYLAQTAQFLGYDVMCVNYSNAASQETICLGDPDCFAAISQSKLDATGPCSVPNGAHCGHDPKTGQPYVNSNPADAVTRRISMMLQYLAANENVNGTDWSEYLSGTTPVWSKIVLAGHSQGGDMATFTAYNHAVLRAINVSGPPQATPVDGVEQGAPYLAGARQTGLSGIYAFVSVNDTRYIQGVYAAVWQQLGFTAANNDAEEKLDLPGATVGMNCNVGVPSHNFSSSAPTARGTGHDDTLYPWFEDIYEFMLTQ